MDNAAPTERHLAAERAAAAWLARRDGAGWSPADEHALACWLDADIAHRVGYLRLHGRNKASWWEGQSAAERHDYLYTRAEMDEWAEKIALVTDDLSELYVYFQNTTKGHALKNIPMLREALNARGVPVKTPEPGEEEGRLL